MKKIFTLMMMAVLAAPVMAQEEVDLSSIQEQSVTALRHYKFADNWFVSGFYGGNFSMSENTRHNGFAKNMNPSYGVAVGKWLSPAIGLRLKFDHLLHTGYANEEAVAAYPEIYGNGKYKFKMWTSYFDVMLNLNNIIGQFRESTKLNAYMAMGVGFVRSFGFNDLRQWADKGAQKGYEEFAQYEVYTHPKNHMAGQVGFGAWYEISKAFDINFEVMANITNDKYNGVIDDQLYDAYINAQVGFTYHFLDHFGDHRFKHRRLSDADMLRGLNDKINAARKDLANAQPATKIEDTYQQLEILDMTVNFIIDKYNITDLQKKNVAAVAKYIKEHPEYTVIVTGYADVQTAYPAYNLKLSERRAKAVFNMLVKDYGVDPKRLKIDYRGDIIQPYNRKNEWNRVVVFVLERNK